MFNEEKVEYFQFYGHFTPSFLHLEPYRSQTVHV